MNDTNTMPYTFGPGFVQSNSIGRVIAQFDELVSDGSVSSILMMWSQKRRRWSHFNLGWKALRICASKSQMFALGGHGTIMIADATGTREEIVDDSDEGPGERGNLNDMRIIGDHLYVAGLGRQVYRREGQARWVRGDQGVVLPAGSGREAGFNAIDGMDESDMVAVGLGGEIWRYTGGAWHQVESPTDRALECVQVIAADLGFAAGHDGTLVRGCEDDWRVIEHDATRSTIKDMQWFKGKLYVSSDDGLFVLEGKDGLKRINLGLGAWWTCGYLHANDGVMWSFGPKHLAWTEDAVKWNNVTPSFTQVDTTSDQSSCSCSEGGHAGGGHTGGAHTGGGHRCS